MLLFGRPEDVDQTGPLIPRDRGAGYIAAVVLTVAVTLVARELQPLWDVTGRHPYLIEWPTIILAAWLGGLGPALLSTALATAAILFYWVEPPPHLRLQHPSDLVALTIFAVCGVVVSNLIERLHHMGQQERRLRRSREIVLGIVAHDLRNPLGTIHMATTLLRQRPDDVRRLDTIDRATRRMEHLIRDLLDASVLDNDAGLTLALAEEEVASFVAEAVVDATPGADAKSIAIAVEVRPGLRVRCDRGRMLQVLSNLLGNAVKFTPDGGRIVVRATKVEPFVRVEVSDTGPGIRPEQQPLVFERHWSGRTVRAGVGLGLFIARGIVRGHGGQIRVHSNPGHGSTFFFTIPAVESGSF